MNPIRSVAALPGRLFETMGFSYLSMDFMRFLKMHSFYNIAVNLSGVFVSTFLLKAGSGFMVVALYYLTAYVGETVGNALMPRFGTRFSQAASSRFGMLLYLASYLLLLGFRERVLLFYPLVAILSAVGASLYWFPYHYYTMSYTMPQNRQLGISLLGMVGNMIVLIAPLVSGLLTSQTEGIKGYVLIFSLSALSFLIAVLLSRKLPSAPSERPKNALWLFLREELFTPIVSAVSLAHLLYGLRDGVFMYFLNILIFDMISGELALGLNITLRSILVIVTFLLMARFLTPARRLRLNFAVPVFALGLSLLLLGIPTAPVLFVIAVLDAVTQAFTHNSLQLATYELSDHITSGAKHHRELAIALRNISLNCGRAIGLILLIVISLLFEGVLVWPLALLNGLALLAAFPLRKIARRHG